MQVRSTDLDYETIIRELVFSAAKRHVPAERWAAFQQEVARREASRKEAGVEFLVATLDRELQLTDRQRDQLMKSLSSNWDSLWYAALELTLAGRPCVPRIPDDLVIPYLSETQRAIWGRMYKFEGPLWGVALDHGGEPDLEEALGARPNPDARGALRVRIVPGARQARVRTVE